MRIALLLLLDRDHAGACFRQTGQLATAEERQLHNVRQLTFGGRNAEGNLDICSMTPRASTGNSSPASPVPTADGCTRPMARGSSTGRTTLPRRRRSAILGNCSNKTSFGPRPGAVDDAGRWQQQTPTANAFSSLPIPAQWAAWGISNFTRSTSMAVIGSGSPIVLDWTDFRFSVPLASS
jgi:hypothetical protein